MSVTVLIPGFDFPLYFRNGTTVEQIVDSLKCSFIETHGCLWHTLIYKAENNPPAGKGGEEYSRKMRNDEVLVGGWYVWGNERHEDSLFVKEELVAQALDRSGVVAIQMSDLVELMYVSLGMTARHAVRDCCKRFGLKGGYLVEVKPEASVENRRRMGSDEQLHGGCYELVDYEEDLSMFDEQPETEIEDNSERVTIVAADLEESLYFYSSTVESIIQTLKRSFGFTGGYLVQEHSLDKGYFKQIQNDEVLVRGCYEFVNYVAAPAADETPIEIDHSDDVAILVADLEEILYFHTGMTAKLTLRILWVGFGFRRGRLIKTTLEPVENGERKITRRELRNDEVLGAGCYEFVDYTVGNVQRNSYPPESVQPAAEPEERVGEILETVISDRLYRVGCSESAFADW